MVLICLVQTPAAEVADSTAGFRNGRFWQKLGPAAKISDTYGFFDGMGYADLEAAYPQGPAYFVKTSTFGKTTTAIDLFYGDPANIPIPIGVALRIVGMKARGDGPATIEARVAAVRRSIATSSK